MTNGKKIDDEIKSVKEELHRIGIQKQKLIIRLGEAFEGVIKPESICKEIKKALKDEIEKGLISRRLIELYCLDRWKKKTSPKSEKISLPHRRVPVMVIDVQGNVNPPAASTGVSNRGTDIHSSLEYLNNKDNRNLPSEISISYRELSSHMAKEFKIHQGSEPVLIRGAIDKISGKVSGVLLVPSSDDKIDDGDITRRGAQP